jgi:hypothetical protein
MERISCDDHMWAAVAAAANHKQHPDTQDTWLHLPYTAILLFPAPSLYLYLEGRVVTRGQGVARRYWASGKDWLMVVQKCSSG